MRVLITGATGLIGSEIAKQCQSKNIAINYLTTNKSKLSTAEGFKGFYWNPSESIIDIECLKDVDVIIHLVGASISKRWTDNYKKQIISSRTQTTQLLFNTLKNNPNQVTQIISASAIGIYPSSMTKYYTEENTEVSTSFLGQVVQQWEQAVDLFSTLNINVAKIRIGLVLSAKGGALPEMAKPIKFGAGAAFGSGKQWQSWIHITDLANLFLYVLDNKLKGVYNGVAPNPETNQHLTKAIAKQLKRPVILPNIPKFMMNFILGEMHNLLFESQRVSSKKVETSGFNFEYYNLQMALEEEL
ncbi:TIGR01777 family oxidoreductase [Olleya sp. R77988]|uniref:TIGR01777 family oxidoreductase n=1 Tax=Olleya sp. R77988 TaxID=3093875 RepID=UPI0037C6D46E